MPVKIRGVSPDGIERIEEAETVAIGQFGALLLTSFRPKIDSILYVTNSRSQETEKFRVAWLAVQPQEGRWPVGVAGFHAFDQFWGSWTRFQKPQGEYRQTGVPVRILFLARRSTISLNGPRRRR